MQLCMYMKGFKPLIITQERYESIALRFILGVSLQFHGFPLKRWLYFILGGNRCEFPTGNCSSGLMFCFVTLSTPVSLFWPKKSKKCLIPTDIGHPGQTGLDGGKADISP